MAAHAPITQYRTAARAASHHFFELINSSHSTTQKNQYLTQLRTVLTELWTRIEQSKGSPAPVRFHCCSSNDREAIRELARAIGIRP